MGASSDNGKNKNPWERLEGQELELHALEDLTQILNQAKSEEERSAKPEAGPTQEQRTTQIDHLFQHVIGRLQEESQKDAGALAKRLSALEKLEKGFLGLLVARIEAIEQRLHFLQRERMRLERLIDTSSKSILGMLFTGVKSQFQLKNIKAELHILHEEKQRIWQKKRAFNTARAAVIGKSKESAQTVLQSLYEAGLLRLQDRLLGVLDECLRQAEGAGMAFAFALEEGAVSEGQRFGRFVKGLSPREKNFIDCASDEKSYAHGADELLTELDDILQEYGVSDASAIPNRCLFFAKLLVGRLEKPSIPPDICAALYRLFEGKGSVDQKALATLVASWSPRVKNHVARVIDLVNRITVLNLRKATHASETTIRRNLVRIFRDFLIRYADVLSGLSEQEKPVMTERRRHQEKVNRVIEEALRYLVSHWDSLNP